MKNKRLIIILSSVVILLLIPLIAMHFTDEVVWTGFDFLVMGILLLTTGLSCEFAMRKVKTFNYRIIILIAIIGAFILIWAELAVGIFGTPFGGQ